MEGMSCDSKIAIGATIPHPTASFGGGGKSVLPGVAHMNRIRFNHHHVGGLGQPGREDPLGKYGPSIGFGKVKGNLIHGDIAKAVRIAGFDIIVNAMCYSK
jgi:nickel-dependent lactate racemase